MISSLPQQTAYIPTPSLQPPNNTQAHQTTILQHPRLEAADRFQGSSGQISPQYIIIQQQTPPKQAMPLWQKILGAGALLGITVGAGFGIKHLATHPEARERFLTEATSGLAWGFTWGLAEEAGSAFFHTIGRVFTQLFE